jgi:hypothetical protein
MKEKYEAPSLEIIKFTENEDLECSITSAMDGNDIQAMWLRGS